MNAQNSKHSRSSVNLPYFDIRVSSSAGGLRPLLRWQLAAASLGAAAIHFAVIVPHINEYTAFGVFFLVVAWFQAAWAVLVAKTDDRRLLLVGVVANAVVVLVWIWSRTAGLPIGPEPGVAEEVGAPDAISTMLEAVIIVWTTLLLTPVYRSREPSRRFAVGSAVFVWAVIVGLTALAIIAEAKSTPAGH